MIKKVVIIFMILFTVLSLFGCNYYKKNHGITLPKYDIEECYWGEGFQDYTDYCKYVYNETSIKKFETHAKFEKVTDSDIENIKSYFEDFGERVKDEKYYDKYDFDFQSQIKTGDYFCIIAKEEIEVVEGVFDKFYNYNVYYVDMSKCILYFIHSNT